MEQITFNPNNEPYYSEDFIKGFKCGAQRQFEADKSDDLIKRSDAIKALNREKSDWNCDYNVPIDNCIKRLNKVKSADRPSIDIVRCQDCKHWVYNFNGCKRNPCTEPWYATDFCNYGEREGE